MVKTKLKPVLPSLREKKRYLVFDVISKEKINDFGLVSEAIQSSALDFLGRFGAAKAGIMALSNKWNPQLQRGIIKIGHKNVDAVKAALTFIHKVGNTDAIFRSVGVSGILKKAESKFLKTD